MKMKALCRKQNFARFTLSTGAPTRTKFSTFGFLPSAEF